MGTSISGLNAVTSLADADVFEVSQSGESKKVTKLLLFQTLFPNYADWLTVDDAILPQTGDVYVHDGTDAAPGASSRWRVIPQEAYTEAAVASSSTITFAGGGPTGGILLGADDYFTVGTPVRVVIAATAYYGICTAVTDTLLTIGGRSLPAATAIDSISVGARDMVKHVRCVFGDATYDGVEGGTVTKNCLSIWKGKTGYLSAVSAAHMGVDGSTIVRCYFNGIVDLVFQITPAAGTATTYGAFVDHAGSFDEDYSIADGESIQFVTLTIGTANSYLIVNLTFVVP